MKYLCILLALFLACTVNTASDRGGDLEIEERQGAEYAGLVEIELYNSNQGMPVRFTDGYYEAVNPYPSGTEFRYRLYIENPVYVYAFAGDSGSAETTRIFPPEGQNFSPIVNFSEKGVFFPGEFTWIRLDERTGTDYLVTLFAREALDIDQIRKRFEKTTGSFPARVAAAVGENFIVAENAHYEPGEMRFFSRSAHSKNIFGLLLAIEHHEG